MSYQLTAETALAYAEISASLHDHSEARRYRQLAREITNRQKEQAREAEKRVAFRRWQMREG